MGHIIRTIRVSPAPPLPDARPFLIATSAILRVELPDSDTPAPEGVFLIEVRGYPGRYWSHNLGVEDIPEGVPITREAQQYL